MSNKKKSEVMADDSCRDTYVVINPFGNYVVGDIINEKDELIEILKFPHYANNIVKTSNKRG